MLWEHTNCDGSAALLRRTWSTLLTGVPPPTRLAALCACLSCLPCPDPLAACSSAPVPLRLTHLSPMPALRCRLC